MRNHFGIRITEHRKEILLALLLTVVFTLLNVYSFLILIIPVIYILNKYMNNELILFFALFSMIGLSADIGDELRLAVNLFSIAALLFGAFLNSRERGGKLMALPDYLLFFFIFNIILLLVSASFSGYLMVGLSETIRQIMFFVILYLIYQIYNDFAQFQKLIDYIIIISGIVSITITVSFFSSVTSLEKLLTEVFVKEGGIFSNVAAPGGLIGLSIVLLNYRMLSTTQSFLNIRRLQKWLMVILVIGLFLTNSRAAILTALVGTIIIQLFLNRKKFLNYTAIIIIILGSLFLISLPFFDIINLYLRTDRVLENTRYVIWELTWNMIESNFMFGTGPGVAKYTWTQYTNVMFNTWTGDQVAWVFEKGGSGHSHNFLLFRWSELGIFGLLSGLWIYIFFPLVLFRNMKNHTLRPEVKELNIAIFACVIGFFVRSMLEATGILTNGWVSRDLPFWILILMAFHFYRKKPGFREKTEGQES